MKLAKVLFVFLAAISLKAAAQPTLNVPQSVTTYSTVASWPGLVNYPNTTNRNFVRVYAPQKPIADESLINLADLNSGGANGPMPVATSYFDGLGRPLQEVLRQGVTNNTLDLIQVHVYDEIGRENYQYPLYSNFDNLATRGKMHENPLTQLSAQYNALYPGENPYSKTESDNSPLNRVTKQMSPGHNWVGNSLGTTYQYGSTYQFVAKWTVAFTMNAAPIFGGYYPDGELYKTMATDEDGLQTEEYKDKEGKLILKRQFFSTTISPPPTAVNGYHPYYYSQTYYVYDDLGHLRWVITPEAVKQSITSNWQTSWSISTAIRNGLCYRYWYDVRGRLIEKKLPGKEEEYYVYDTKDRLVMTQDGNLRAVSTNKKWLYTIYDALNRPIVTGIYNSNSSRQTLTNNLTSTTTYGTSDVRYWLKTFTFHSYPGTLTNCEELTRAQYDEYDAGASFDDSYNSKLTGTAPYCSLPEQSLHTRGVITKTLVKVMGSSPAQWLTTKSFYDALGRLIQQQSNNQKGGGDITTTEYDFSSTVRSTVQIHHNPAANQTAYQQTEIISKYDKDYNTNAITGLSQNINSTGFRSVYATTYDVLNRVNYKHLLNFPNNFTYNIRGWLTGINPDYINGSAAQAGPFFGEQLFYDQGFADHHYNGDIAGIIWKGASPTDPNLPPAPKRCYGYSYDKINRLTHAEFRQFDNSSWTHANVDFTASNITYDYNGNIKTMNQRGPGVVAGVTTPVDMDILSYQYLANSNQLDGVKENSTVTGQTTPDFKDDGGGAQTGDYTYDANGNLTLDNNKGITSISYNSLNKPENIVTGQGMIQYVYDAAGNKLQKKVTPTGVATITTEYIDNFEYKDNDLQFIYHPEGRYRPFINAQGTASFLIDFFIKDHLGNVRTMVNAEPSGLGPVLQYSAGLEIALANTEAALWQHLDDVRETRPLMTNPNDTKAAEMNGADPEKRIGPAIMLRVMPGDKFSLSAQTYYDESWADSTAESEDMVSSLLNALVGGSNYSGIPLNELPDNIKVVEETIGETNFTSVYDNLVSNNTDPLRPKAHLNYLLFDENDRLIEENSGVLQYDGPASQWNTLSTNGEIEVQKVGYLLVFASNKTQSSVFADQFDLTFYRGSVLEEDHYYPFGLTLTEGTPYQSEKNDIKFQSQRFDDDFGIGMYSFKYRDHDPQIGRFWEIDPLSEKYVHNSTYAFSENKVTSHRELEGLEAEDFRYTYWTNTSGAVESNETWSQGSNSMGHGSDGISVSVSGEPGGTNGSYYVPDCNVVAESSDNRSVDQKFGDFAGGLVNSYLGGTYNSVDNFMSSASEVGVKFDFTLSYKTNSLNVSLGMFSTSENNFGLMASTNYQNDIGVKASGEGVSNTNSGGGSLYSMKLSLYANHAPEASTPQSGTSVRDNSTPYVSRSAGPFSTEKSMEGNVVKSQFSIGLGKSFQAKSPSMGAGLKNKSEMKFKTPLYNLPH